MEKTTDSHGKNTTFLQLKYKCMEFINNYTPAASMRGGAPMALDRVDEPDWVPGGDEAWWYGYGGADVEEDESLNAIKGWRGKGKGKGAACFHGGELGWVKPFSDARASEPFAWALPERSLVLGVMANGKLTMC